MSNLTNTTNVINAIRYAVKARGYWATFVADNQITRDMIADTARELAALAYPNDEPVQKQDGKRTRFGNAVQAAGNGMRSVLDADEDKTPATPDWLRLAIQAAENAVNKGELSPNAVAEAVTFHLSGLLTVEDAA